MNTKHFFSVTLCVIGLLLSSINVDAQRNYNRDDRGRDQYQRHAPRHRGQMRGHRHGRPAFVCAPPIRHRRIVRRHVPCAPLAYYAPSRRGHHHRWHR